jgi:hypothetical protein
MAAHDVEQREEQHGPLVGGFKHRVNKAYNGLLYDFGKLMAGCRNQSDSVFAEAFHPKNSLPRHQPAIRTLDCVVRSHTELIENAPLLEDVFTTANSPRTGRDTV